MDKTDQEKYFEIVIQDYVCGDIEYLLQVLEESPERPGPLLHCTVAGIDAVGGMLYGFGASEARSVRFMEDYFGLSNEEARMIYGLVRCGIAHEGITKLVVRFFAPLRRARAGQFLYNAPDNSIWLNVAELARSFLDLHFPRKPIGEQAPADEISPPHLRGRKLPQPGSVR